MNDIRQNCIFGDNAVPYIEELQQYISKLDSFDQKILEFDEVFPQYSWFSQTKKLDFLLWQMRD